MEQETDFQSGAACAAIVSAGVGLAVFGITVCASESSPTVAKALTLYKPTGPLSGKIAVGMIVWLVAWALLHRGWAGKDRNVRQALWLCLFLGGIGLALTFPPIMEIASGH